MISMSPDTSFFSAVLDQETVPFDLNHNKYAVEALLGFPSIDQTEGIPFLDPAMFTLNLHDFPEQYPVQVDLSPSPRVLSPPSLPPSPLSSADDLSDLGALDVSTPYSSSLSPTGLFAPIPLPNVDDMKPTKSDLDGFEYNSSNRKWICTKCGDDFVSTHEARRHVKTAAKCTGKKVMCLRCGDRIHASQWSRKRHFLSKKCQKRGRKRGTPAYTVNTAYAEL